MTQTTPKTTYLFDRIFVFLAIGSPILMVIAAGMLPVGSRGRMMVTGHELLVAILGLALVSRAVRESGWVQCVRATARAVAGIRDRVRRTVSRDRGAKNTLH